MNLFWKKLFGGVPTTAKLEATHAQLINDYQRYISVEGSKELKEYQELFETVKSSDFKENKKTLKSRKYKDTQWYRDYTKFDKLNKDANIRRYYTLLENKELANFLKFKNSADYSLLGKPEEVKANPQLAAYKKFETSAEYKLYTRFHNSYIVKEYEELKAKVTTEEFKKENEFWSNAKRWETTEAYQMEQRYFELAGNTDIQFYNSASANKFEVIKNYQVCFKEEFNWNSLNNSKWECGFHHAAENLKNCYSFAHEQQANNKGKNISVSNGVMHLATKEEHIKASAWDAKRGFIEKEFNYTSDVIHSRNAVCRQGGVFRAKMRFTGNKNVGHAFWLSGEKKTPHINICKYNGKGVEVGIHWSSKFENKYSSNFVTGLNFNDWLIYTLEWTNKELVWYINDIEVYRTSDYVPTENMVPLFSSFIEENKNAGSAALEVDYMGVYCKD